MVVVVVAPISSSGAAVGLLFLNTGNVASSAGMVVTVEIVFVLYSLVNVAGWRSLGWTYEV